MEIEHPLIKLIICLSEYLAEHATIPLHILHHLKRLLIDLRPLKAQPQGLDHDIIELSPHILLVVQDHLEVLHSRADVLVGEVALGTLKEYFGVFLDVVDVRVGLRGVLVGADVEQQVARPDVDLGGAGAVCHVGLQVRKGFIGLAQ
jgi:hypothetical protein